MLEHGGAGREWGGLPTFRFPKLGKLLEVHCMPVVSPDIRKRIATSGNTENKHELGLSWATQDVFMLFMENTKLKDYTEATMIHGSHLCLFGVNTNDLISSELLSGSHWGHRLSLYYYSSILTPNSIHKINSWSKIVARTPTIQLQCRLKERQTERVRYLF